jgi:hypothetical protein
MTAAKIPRCAAAICRPPIDKLEDYPLLKVADGTESADTILAEWGFIGI